MQFTDWRQGMVHARRTMSARRGVPPTAQTGTLECAPGGVCAAARRGWAWQHVGERGMKMDERESETRADMETFGLHGRSGGEGGFKGGHVVVPCSYGPQSG